MQKSLISGSSSAAASSSSSSAAAAAAGRRGSRPFLSPDVIPDSASGSDAAAVAAAGSPSDGAGAGRGRGSRKGSLSPEYSAASDEGNLGKEQTLHFIIGLVHCFKDF